MTRLSLTNKLDELFGLQNDYFGYEDLVVTFSKNPGATEDELILAKSNMAIPDDYSDFLRKYNGCTLFQYGELGGFEFFGTYDLVKENEFQKENFEEDWENNITIFCNLICDGDFISFRNYSNGTYEIFYCDHDVLPKDWTLICNSFDDFLEKLIDEKGQRYWLQTAK